MWQMETELIPVVIDALGVIKKELEKYVDKIPGTASINELQKITLLRTAYCTSSERFCQSSELFRPWFGSHDLALVLQRLN